MSARTRRLFTRRHTRQPKQPPTSPVNEPRSDETPEPALGDPRTVNARYSAKETP